MATLLYWPIVDVDVESLPDPASTLMANKRESLYYELEQVTKDLDYLFFYRKEDLERQDRQFERMEGKEEGIKENTINLIKSMLENNADYDFVSKVTGKTIEEIKKIERNK